jgi:amino acid adenylation domain-containing protein/thioester reductase-like protein
VTKSPAPARERLAELTREQRARLFEQVRKRQQQAQRAGAAAARIPRRPAGLDPVPASFAQERLWFMDRLVPGNPAYNVPLALRIEGGLVPAALAAALGEVVRRHEALRTTFAERDGQPVQVIAPPAARFLLPRVDLGALPATVRAAAARRLAQEEVERPFDLVRGPLLRTVLLRLGPAEHALLLGMHHIVSDGWSMGVLVREVSTLYTRLAHLAAGDGLASPSPLPGLAIQYADFAVWQRGWLSGEVLERQIAYWRQQLAGAPAALALPADRPRPAMQTLRGARLRATFDAGLTQRLAQLARRHEASPYMLLLAGFQALLGRLSGQRDLVVGSPIANRHRTEVEPLIGFFVNTLAMRGDLAGDPPFGELIARTRRTALAAYAHQDLPFERLVGELRPERHLSSTPLFQAVCAMQNAPVGRVELPGIALAPIAATARTVQFDLELHAWEADDELLLVLAYSAELFDAATACRLAGQLETLLRGALDHEELPLSALPLLGDGQRHQLLREWNDQPGVPRPATGGAAADRPGGGAPGEDVLAGLGALGIAGQVAARAALTPAALAVAGPDGELRYGELLARASRLARELRALGIDPDVPVGLCAGRSPELAVGALAVLLAGGCYLPLDPAYPEERLAAIAAQSGMPALLLAGGGEERPAWLPRQARVLRLAEREGDAAAGDAAAAVAAAAAAAAGSAAAALPDAGAAPRPDPLQLAYVIYTSGSTGEPKGVGVSHAGVAGLLRWHLRTYGVSARDRATLIVSPAFDASVLELWPFLAAGASLHVPDEEVRLSAPRLLAWLAAERITLCLLPTPLAEQLIEAAERATPAGLRLRVLLAGGDRLRRAPRRPLSFALVNHYGPTEAAVAATFARIAPTPPPPACGSAAAVAGRPPTIGRPIDGMRAHVVDARLEPAPVGIPGELLLGGAGVARGYLGRPALTAERFVPDPFAASQGDAGSRLYRTGDLVRVLADGNLDFIGRLDGQVKLRGFRIELGEIESALLRHPGVAAAVAAMVAAGPGAGAGRQLAAYVVARAGRAGGANDANDANDARRAELARDLVPELRRLLKAALPEYMVPAAFVLLDGLPLTAHGKVDRAALPAPDLARTAPTAAFTAPRTPLEESLCAIWADILEVERVGAGDNFFELGGHSLLATQLVSRLADRFGIELPLRALFEEPTVAGLAERVAELLPAGTSGPGPLPPPLLPVARDAALPLSYAQERLWFLDRLEPGSTTYHMPIALELAGRLSPAALAAALSGVVRRHEALRTTFVEVAGDPVQLVAPARPLAIPAVDLGSLPEPRRRPTALRLIAAAALRPFDLAAGPLLRPLLVRLGPELHVALLALHHIVADGWSMGILVRELREIYAATLTGRAPALAPLRVQYADFAAWQRQWLAGPVLARQIAWWREQLAGAPALLDLPLDRPRPPLQTLRAGLLPVTLAAELSRGIAALGRARGATPFMVLLAAFAALLSRFSGQDDVVVGTPVANRNRTPIEGLIGFFVNTLALRVKLPAEASFDEHLGRVREVALGGYAHQDVPFEKLILELQPQRSLAHSALFQAMLSVQNAPVGRLELPGLSLAPVPVELGRAKFDLSLDLAELPAGLATLWEYDADLFDRATVGRLAGAFELLLAAAVREPHLPLARLPLLAPAQRHQLLREWNDEPGVPRPATGGAAAGLYELFAASAARVPDAVALCFCGAALCLSYAELARRAGHLARSLRRRGIGAEVPVGVCAERSCEAAVALLSVLAAGGAWLPLDPEQPRERLALLLAEARPAVVLTQGRCAERLPAGTPVLAVESVLPGGEGGDQGGGDGGDGRGDGDRQAWAPRTVPEVPETLAAFAAPPDSLAYVIYTSGSTGAPKGVMVGHRAIVGEMLRIAERQPLTARDVFLQHTPLSFDASLWEIFLPFAAGARLVVARPGDHRDAAALARAVVEEQVTVLQVVPSLLGPLLDEPGMAARGSLRRLVSGGEALPGPLAREALARLDVELWNLYGPTECAIDATAWRCGAAERRGLPRSVPIGRPLQGVRVRVLDRRQEISPLGVPGELCVGGVGLARGYLSRPDLTAERFIPDPYGKQPGERVYRTGDLVRTLADGSLEFLRRVDQQVKLRGVRIELGEIEAALAAHPGLAQAAVVLAADPPRLVAFVAGRGVSAPGAAELRRHLLGRLPEAMVPAAWVEMTALPLLPSGKVDRQALASRTRGALAERAAYQAPRTATEETIAAIWEEVLGLPRVGVGDDFFALGGHSLLATRVVSRLRAAFGVEVPLRGLFAEPALAGLAGLVERVLAAGRAGAAPLDGGAVEEVAATAERLRADAVLDADIRPEGPRAGAGLDPDVLAAPRAVLLTGATGFLGAHLLRELLHQTGAIVYCLVRADGPEQARQRLLAAVQPLDLAPEQVAARVVPLAGDLAHPSFGLEPGLVESLAREVELIWHNGALVKFLAAYPALHAANVLGTREVLRLACRGRVKPVIYVSSLDVITAVAHAAGGTVTEDEPLGDCGGLQGGYPQSKWVAEKLVRAAGERGLPVCVMRPGLVTGDSRTGRGGGGDLVTRLLASILRLGAFPEGMGEIDLVPVDFVAAAAVWLARRRASFGRTFHLTNPRPASLGGLNRGLRSRGYALTQVSAERFHALLAAQVAADDSHPLAPFAEMFGEHRPRTSEDTGGRSPATAGVHCDNRQTFAALAESGIVCPPVDAALLATYFSYLERTGVLPMPEAPAST